MVYICLLHAGRFSEAIQPFASMTIKGLYEDAACIVPGNNEKYCPNDPQKSECYASTCVSGTDFCATEQVATFARQEKRDKKTNELSIKYEPTWHREKRQHTCCHYPETEAVWDSQWARIDLWDEDALGGNDYLGGLDLDLQNKADANFTFVVAEHEEDFSLKGNNITVEVATFWHKPMDFAVSHEWDASPKHWSSLGLSVTASGPPWEVHKEFDGTFGNLRFEEVDEFVFESEADKQALAQDAAMNERYERIEEAKESQKRMKEDWDESVADYRLRTEPTRRTASATLAPAAALLAVGAAALAVVARRRAARPLLGEETARSDAPMM